MTQEAPKPVDVMAEILEAAGLEDVNDVPLGLEFDWGKKGLWKANEPVPLAGYEFLDIFALFQSGDEVRVYAVPKREGPEGSQPVPHRFTLSKTSPARFTEIIRVKDVFVDEVAEELANLLGVPGTVDDFEEEEEEPNGAATAPTS